MKNFCEFLEEFEIAMTVDVYKKAIPNEVDEELILVFSEMVLKMDKPESQCTLHEVRSLNKVIIAKSTLCSHLASTLEQCPQAVWFLGLDFLPVRWAGC